MIVRIKRYLFLYFRNLPHLPIRLVLLVDYLFVLLACAAGFLIIYPPVPDAQLLRSVPVYGVPFLLILVGFMNWKKSFKGVIRHTTLQEVIQLTFIHFGSFLCFLPVYFILSNLPGVEPLGIAAFVLCTALSYSFLMAYRLLVKQLFWNNKIRRTRQMHVLLYGAGEIGISVYQLLLKDFGTRYINHGFIDDDPKKTGKYLMGVKIHSSGEGMLELMDSHPIEELIICTGQLAPAQLEAVYEACYARNVRVKRTPDLRYWKEGQFNVSDIQQIKMEELLGRESIDIDQGHLSGEFDGEVVLVTGAGGSIGSELCRQLAKYPLGKLVLLDQSESALYDIQQELRSIFPDLPIVPVLGDIKRKRLLRAVFRRETPKLVFHAAAYKHVPMLENYPLQAIENNVLGTRNLADLSLLYRVRKFIMVSTDKAVNPSNVMGATKRVAEKYVQSLSQQGGATQFITTRFGNVLGSNGSVIPLFRRQIEQGGPITVTNRDMVRYFMTIPEACRLVMEACKMGHGGEIFVFDMGKPVNIYELAEKMIVMAGKTPNVDMHVTISGLREGEKMYEELHSDLEYALPTHHPKIHIVSSEKADASWLVSEIRGLEGLCRKEADETALVRQLKVLVPEFISKASRFSALDTTPAVVKE